MRKGSLRRVRALSDRGISVHQCHGRLGVGGTHDEDPPEPAVGVEGLTGKDELAVGLQPLQVGKMQADDAAFVIGQILQVEIFADGLQAEQELANLNGLRQGRNGQKEYK